MLFLEFQFPVANTTDRSIVSAERDGYLVFALNTAAHVAELPSRQLSTILLLPQSLDHLFQQLRQPNVRPVGPQWDLVGSDFWADADRFGPGSSRRSQTATLLLGSERLRRDDSEAMAKSYSHQADLAQDNRILHIVIRDIRKSVDAAARELHKMLEDHETFEAETPIEVWTAMEIAAESLTDALRCLNQVKTKVDPSATGGPTRAIELTIALELIPPLDRPFRL